MPAPARLQLRAARRAARLIRTSVNAREVTRAVLFILLGFLAGIWAVRKTGGAVSPSLVLPDKAATGCTSSAIKASGVHEQSKIAPPTVAPAAPAGPAAAAKPPQVIPSPLATTFPAPNMPYLSVYQELFQRHSVDGLVLFAVVGFDKNKPESRVIEITQNWVEGVKVAYPQFAEKRLLIGLDSDTCMMLSQRGVSNCWVDTHSHWAGRREDANTRLKHYIAWVALSLGYRVLFNDVDVYFPKAAYEKKGKSSPQGPLLDYLTTHMRAIGDGQLPDIVMLSDYQRDSYALSCAKDGAEGHTVAQLVTSTSSQWQRNTIDVWYNDGMLSCGSCPIQHMYAQRQETHQCTCLSTGFWLAIPTDTTLRFFSLLTAELSRPGYVWEQKVWNQLLPQLFYMPAGPANPFLPKLVVLDPRVIGNEVSYKCVSNFRDTLIHWRDKKPLPRLVVHPGYVLDVEVKRQIGVDAGGWYLAASVTPTPSISPSASPSSSRLPPPPPPPPPAPPAAPPAAKP